MSATKRTLVAVGSTYTKCPVYPVGESGSSTMVGPGVRSTSSARATSVVDMLSTIASAGTSAATRVRCRA
jgi:hypothetical protein